VKRAALYFRVLTGERTVENQRCDLEVAAYNDDGISGTKGRVEFSPG